MRLHSQLHSPTAATWASSTASKGSSWDSSAKAPGQAPKEPAAAATGAGEPVAAARGGGSSPPGPTPLVTNPPAPQSPPASTTAAGKPAAKAAAKVKILSHKVHGDVATILIDAPAAGSILLSGKGVRSLHAHATKAGQHVSLRAVLTKAGTSSLHKHHNHLKVSLRVSFTQTGGPS